MERREEYIPKDLYDEIAASSNILRGDEYRQMICGVSQVTSDMVVKTLGPYGCTTVIDEGTGFTYPSKDGWNCINKLQFTDPTYNSLLQMLKKISFNSVTTVGDGTTTAMVAANNFLRDMYMDFIPNAEARKGFRQADFIETMNRICKGLEDELKNNPNIRMIDPEGEYYDIYKIAYVATNGNAEFAKLIQEIYKETKNPNIQVSLGRSMDTIYEIQEGYKFDAHVLNYPYYVNAEEGENVISYKNQPCGVIIFDHNVTFQTHNLIITSIAQIANKVGNTIIIMAPYFDSITTTLINDAILQMAQRNTRPNIMLVQIPNSMKMHVTAINDLAVLTNAQLFDESRVKAFNLIHHNQTHDENDQISDPILEIEEYKQTNPEQIIMAALGRTKTIVFRKNEGFLQDYENIVSPIEYNALMEEVKTVYENAKKEANKSINGTLDKDYLAAQMRYIRLIGHTGVIHVGGGSDIQQRCDKDSLDDAVLACRSAFENGYVRGMNLELLSIIRRHLDDTMNDTVGAYDNKIYELLYNAFYYTSLQVMMNKYPDNEAKRIVSVRDLDNAEIMGSNPIQMRLNMCNTEILDYLITDEEFPDYNLRTETIHPINGWEVVNSVQTDIEILRAVVNTLTTVITSAQFISVTRRFDPNATSEKSLRARLEEDRRITSNKVNAAIDTLYNSEHYEEMQALIGGFHVDEADFFVDPEESAETENPTFPE